MKNLVKNREISFVWHFTKLENLAGILEHGLVPRLYLEKQVSPESFNDAYRLDGCKGANCCSIGHPNYKMFYSLRSQYPDQEWVVIGVKPEILWKKDCAFCVENAASSSVTSLSIEERKGSVAFNNMFNEVQGKPTRKELGISDNCPTNPQAEILVFDTIEPEYIVGAVFQTTARAEEYSKLYPSFNLIYHRAPFKPRKDYTHW